MDLITELGSGLLAFIRGLPSPVWTVIGTALGIAGTVWVERIRKKNSRAEEKVRRRRGALAEVLSLANDFHWNTNRDRVLIAIPDRITRQEYVDAMENVSTKLNALELALIRAKWDSNANIGFYLTTLQLVARHEANIDLGAVDPNDSLSRTLPPMVEVIRDYEDALQRHFGIDSKVPNLYTDEGRMKFFERLLKTYPQGRPEQDSASAPDTKRHSKGWRTPDNDARSEVLVLNCHSTARSRRYRRGVRVAGMRTRIAKRD